MNRFCLPLKQTSKLGKFELIRDTSTMKSTKRDTSDNVEKVASPTLVLSKLLYI